jgi:hypothetical protein
MAPHARPLELIHWMRLEKAEISHNLERDDVAPSRVELETEQIVVRLST